MRVERSTPLKIETGAGTGVFKEATRCDAFCALIEQSPGALLHPSYADDPPSVRRVAIDALEAARAEYLKLWRQDIRDAFFNLPIEKRRTLRSASAP